VGFAELVAGPARFAPPSRSGARPVADSIVILKKSYRFDESGGIGALARAVREGDGVQALRILRDGRDVVRIREGVRADTLVDALRESALAALASAASAAEPLEVFRWKDETALLCAQRRGALGVTGINDAVERMLQDEGTVDPRRRWYSGRPVMVMRNDYSLGLYNGDIGVILDGADGPRHGFRRPTEARVPSCRVCSPSTKRSTR